MTLNLINVKKYQELSNEFRSNIENSKHLFYDPNGIHGLNHARRVYILVNLIADKENMNEEYRNILIYCALYHDIGRTDNGYGYEHGIKGYIKVKENNLINSNYKHLETVKFIIENHNEDDIKSIKSINSYNIKDKDETIYLYKAFKDADNLDRVRIFDLNIEYLRLESSIGLADHAYELYCETNWGALKL